MRTPPTLPCTLLFPSENSPKHIIDPVAFWVALIGAPILVTLPALSAYFSSVPISFFYIPIFALVLGGPVYLVIGTPLLLWSLRQHEITPGSIAVLAVIAQIAVVIVSTVVVVLFSQIELSTLIPLFGGFGMIFAPLWGATFGWLYLKLRRNIYAPQ